MTVIDGFPVSGELIGFLKKWCGPHTDKNGADDNARYCSHIQDNLTRQLFEADNDQIKVISECLQEIITLKDQFDELSQLLPVIQNNEES